MLQVYKMQQNFEFNIKFVEKTLSAYEFVLNKQCLLYN